MRENLTTQPGVLAAGSKRYSAPRVSGCVHRPKAANQVSGALPISSAAAVTRKGAAGSSAATVVGVRPGGAIRRASSSRASRFRPRSSAVVPGRQRSTA
jgi:hypothetical protein